MIDQKKKGDTQIIIRTHSTLTCILKGKIEREMKRTATPVKLIKLSRLDWNFQLKPTTLEEDMWGPQSTQFGRTKSRKPGTLHC